jgi:hypothetical protein
MAGLAGTILFLAICGWAAIEYHDPKEGQASWADRGWAMDARGLLRGHKMENTLITADILNSRLPAGSTVAFSEVGAVPYYSPGLRWLDTYGLTDSIIAHLPSLNRFRTGVTGDYTSPDTAVGREILRRAPDYIIRWDHAEALESSILGGAYVPYFRAPVKSLFAVPGEYVVQVWRRAQ